MVPTKLYHYCAMRQGDTAGSLQYMDGVVESRAGFHSVEKYTAFKIELAELMGLKDSSAVVLLSLTLIGQEGD